MSNKFVSVIIPVYNDPSGLRDTLNSLVNQDYPKQQYEIILADNGSNDNTLDMAKSFIKKYPELIHIVVENNIKSSYAARNKGIKASNGKIIAFIDADMTVEKDWLSKVVNSLEKNQVKYFACQVEIYLKEKNIFGLYNKMTGFPVEDYVINHHFAPTCCLIARKSVFDKIGLFDSKFISGGDYEFGNRVFEAGYKLYYDNNIVIRHPARSSFRRIFAKFFRTGRGIQQIIFYHPKYYREIGRSILRLQYYLPDKPWGFSKNMKRYEIWNQSSLLTKIGFYLISWEVKLATQLGYTYEKFKSKVKK
ncbi:MAG: glycosyltransferase [Ignavibacteriales bacterium]|nr:glycosyltransferase [Ignavibacteriales bacterium]